MQKSTMESLKKLGKIVGKFISILSILFVVYAIYKLGFDFSSITNWPLFLGIAFVCVLLKCATVFVMGSAWAGWLHFFSGEKIDMRSALRAYVKANIGKYLPGNVMHYVERNMFAANLGISQKKMATSSIIEVMGLVCVAFIVAILVSSSQLLKAFEEIFGDSNKKVIALILFVGILFVVGLIFLFRKKIHEIISEYTLSDFVKTLCKALLKYAFVLISLGLIMVVLYIYMGGEVGWQNGSLIVSGYIIAWVLGFVVPGAPGGIGVRELVITVLLSPVVGAEVVLTLSVTHRLITIIGDFLAYFARLLIGSGRKEE